MSLSVLSVIALTIGVSMGFVFQRSQFCMSLAFSEAFTFGNAKRLQGILILLLVSTVAFNLAIYFGAVGRANVLSVASLDVGSLARLPQTMPVLNLLGGFVFGVGMLIAGGCVAGTLFRIGEGYLAAIITFLGVGISGAVLAVFAADQVKATSTGKTLPEMLNTGPIAVVVGISLVLIGLMVFLDKGGGRG